MLKARLKWKVIPDQTTVRKSTEQERNRTEQNGTERNRTEQNGTERNRTEQNGTERNK